MLLPALTSPSAEKNPPAAIAPSTVTGTSGLFTNPSFRLMSPPAVTSPVTVALPSTVMSPSLPALMLPALGMETRMRLRDAPALNTQRKLVVREVDLADLTAYFQVRA